MCVLDTGYGSGLCFATDVVVVVVVLSDVVQIQ